MVSISWDSNPCLIPSPWVWAGSICLLLLPRIQQTWWDVDSVIRWQKMWLLSWTLFNGLFFFFFWLCTFWWRKLPCWRGSHYMEFWTTAVKVLNLPASMWVRLIITCESLWIEDPVKPCSDSCPAETLR